MKKAMISVAFDAEKLSAAKLYTNAFFACRSSIMTRKKSYVWFLNSCHSRWMYANSCGILRVAAEESGYHKAERSAERRSA